MYFCHSFPIGNSDPRLLFFSALSAPKLEHVSMGRRDIFLSFFRWSYPWSNQEPPFLKAVKDYVRCTVGNLYNSTQVGNDTNPTSDFFQKPQGSKELPLQNPSRKKPTSHFKLSPGFPMGFSSFPKKSPLGCFFFKGTELSEAIGGASINGGWGLTAFGPELTTPKSSESRFVPSDPWVVGIYLPIIYIEFMLKIR